MRGELLYSYYRETRDETMMCALMMQQCAEHSKDVKDTFPEQTP